MKIIQKNVYYFDTCVDSIVKYKEYIVMGGYDYDNTERKGKLIFMDEISEEIVNEIETTGIFLLKVFNELLYVVNIKKLQIYNNFELIKQLEFTKNIFYTEVCEKYIFVASQIGEIDVFDRNDYTFVHKIHENIESIWMMKVINSHLYFGNEFGELFCTDLETWETTKMHRYDTGIICIKHINDNVLATTYDGDVVVFQNYFLAKTWKTTNIWRLEEFKDFYVCATMYDGLTIFDKDFNIIKQIETDSICYGLCLVGNVVYYSSFYTKTVYKIVLE